MWSVALNEKKDGFSSIDYYKAQWKLPAKCSGSTIPRLHV